MKPNALKVRCSYSAHIKRIEQTILSSLIINAVKTKYKLEGKKIIPENTVKSTVNSRYKWLLNLDKNVVQASKSLS